MQLSAITALPVPWGLVLGSIVYVTLVAWTVVDIARRCMVASRYTISAAMAAPARLAAGSRAMPATIASMAPSDAPAETPSVNGVASGLRSIA